MDKTELLNKYKALLSSEDIFRQLFESSNDAIMLLDKDGFFDCNKATLEMFGYKDKPGFCGRHPAEHSPPTQPNGQPSMEAAAEHINRAYETGKDSFEWVHKRADGSIFPAEVLLTPLTHGNVAILQATVRDVTKKKQDEERLTRLNSIMSGRELKMIELKNRIVELEEELAKNS